jgi:hypothetical protein
MRGCRTESVGRQMKVNLGFSVGIDVRTNFSIAHLQSAILMTKHAREIEATTSPPTDNQAKQHLIADHRSYVVSAIYASMSFLEAGINELFLDASDTIRLGDRHERCATLTEAEITSLAEYWIAHKKRKQPTVVEKYQAALMCLKKEKLIEDESPSRDVIHLNKLRNALTHHKPIWSSEMAKDTRISEICDFLGTRISLNPLLPHNKLFPDQMLSHGCANWALSSALAFAEQFYARLRFSEVPYHFVLYRFAGCYES